MAQPMCPICRRPVAADAKTIPFCCERCRVIDLGSWLDEGYKVAAADDDDSSASSEGEDGSRLI